MKCLRPTHIAVERESGYHLVRSVTQMVSSKHRISGRTLEFVSCHDSFLALDGRGALSILDVSFKFARASCLVSGEPWSTVRVEQRGFGGILCLLRSGWGLGLRADKVQEKSQVHKCPVVCASLHRFGCRLRMLKFRRG